ncbi:TetR/AcrR family transcriptional regulator C-terminal domain-containing protein [Kibdelosporangium philippinense]|uniref:TetR/AcrR family transcriptional regulator C-terminal domain-containing protein n=1 Tax=Kibdelosporangium philippinense TaxID=211113 RepID=A0ABS8ZFM6_9PSEU|nr:TetR/AcrR family transcriptional regulator C-terminal domain-containing protein [Kibdelosporangium philippinense]MCE7006232.1 TetR/AcrR family transcriptional regulator C-terminal domain-containing protein [Kibdelosporangium philippinense]
MPRPKSPLITRDAIMRAALHIVDTQGAEALSTNRIAAELGVKGPSLYNHVASRAEIIDGMRELLLAEMDLDLTNLRPWTVACARFARSYRASFAAHPQVVPLLATQPIESPVILGAYEQVFDVLREAGWPDDELFPMVRAVEYVAIGSVLDQVVRTPQEAERAFEIGLTAMLAGFEQRLLARQVP